jgi:hypothetical protein
MPRFDGSGPCGVGPMTGRGLGYCVLKGSREKDHPGVLGYAGLPGIPITRANEPGPGVCRERRFAGRGLPPKSDEGSGRGRGRGRCKGKRRVERW